MRTVKAESLNVEKFLPFGFYANMIDPQAEKIGTAPIEFFRDMVQEDLGGASAPSFSTCRVEPRTLVVDVTECHTATGEGILPLDNDILIHVGPATPADADPPLDKFRVFKVPKGTMVVLRPGVWHHAPFTLKRAPANVLIVLPERTYANDCEVINLDEPDRICIEL
jgi:ureidoglycolate lyase